MIFNAPNMISMFRVLASPIIFFLLLASNADYIIAGGVLYFVAAFTDFLDGWLARKMNLVSSWGRFFDPLADKVLTIGVFVALSYLGIANIVMVIIIILRDVFTTYMRVIADRMNAPIRTSKTAKAKTMIQMLYLSGIIVVMMIDASKGNAGLGIMSGMMEKHIPNIALFFITVLTVWSTVEYIIDNKTVFQNMTKGKKLEN